MEARINKHSSTLALLIPWMAIEPVEQQHLRPRASAARHEDPGPASPIEPRAVGRHRSTLRAEVAAVELRGRGGARARTGKRRAPRRPGRRGRRPVRRERPARTRPSRRQRRPARRPDPSRRGAHAMSPRDVTPRDALMRLGASTAEAVARVLETVAPDAGRARRRVGPARRRRRRSPNLPFGAVAASVSYVDGVTGGNIFVMTPAGARALAAAMMGAPIDARGSVRADRARAVRGRRGHEPDDGRGRGRDQRRARRGDRDLAAGDADPRRLRRPRRGLRDRAARDLDHVSDRRRGLPADPARAERVRGPHGPRDRRDGDGAGRLRRGSRRRARTRGATMSASEASDRVGLQRGAERHPPARLGRARAHPAAARPGGRAPARRRGRARPRRRRPGGSVRQRPALRARPPARHRRRRVGACALGGARRQPLPAPPHPRKGAPS